MGHDGVVFRKSCCGAAVTFPDTPARDAAYAFPVARHMLEQLCKCPEPSGYVEVDCLPKKSHGPDVPAVTDKTVESVEYWDGRDMLPGRNKK